MRGTQREKEKGTRDEHAVGGRYPLNTGHEAKRSPAALHPCPGCSPRREPARIIKMPDRDGEEEGSVPLLPGPA